MRIEKTFKQKKISEKTREMVACKVKRVEKLTKSTTEILITVIEYARVNIKMLHKITIDSDIGRLILILPKICFPNKRCFPRTIT